MIDYYEIGKRIRYYRQLRGHTQESLAFIIETSAAYVSNIERAVKKPSLQKLVAISEALDISINDLVGSPVPDNKPTEEIISTAAYLTGTEKEQFLLALAEIMKMLI